MHISYRDVSYRYYEYDIRDLNFDIDILFIINEIKDSFIVYFLLNFAFLYFY